MKIFDIAKITEKSNLLEYREKLSILFNMQFNVLNRYKYAFTGGYIRLRDNIMIVCLFRLLQFR